MNFTFWISCGFFLQPQEHVLQGGHADSIVDNSLLRAAVEATEQICRDKVKHRDTIRDRYKISPETTLVQLSQPDWSISHDRELNKAMNCQDTKMWRNTKLPEPSLMEAVSLLSTNISDCFHYLGDGQAEVMGPGGEKWAQSSTGCVGISLISLFPFNRKRTPSNPVQPAEFVTANSRKAFVAQYDLKCMIKLWGKPKLQWFSSPDVTPLKKSPFAFLLPCICLYFFFFSMDNSHFHIHYLGIYSHFLRAVYISVHIGCVLTRWHWGCILSPGMSHSPGHRTH